MKRTIGTIFFILIITLALFKLINSALALLLGFMLTLFFGNPFPSKSKKAIHYLLKISVIGLGFGMSVTETLKASKDGFLITFLSIVLTVSLGLFLIKIFKIDKKLGFLITSGTSICGGSAIAAISPVIRANHSVTSIAIGVVFLLNSIALFIFPAIGHWLNLTQSQFGLWCAIAIHDTSSVVGAALEFGDKALKIATTVKLARTLWIIPLSFLAMMIFKSKSQRVKIPYFILGFIIAMLLNSYKIIPSEVSTTLVDISKRLLIITLFLIGVNLSFKDVKENGIKPVAIAVILWVFVSVFSLSFILLR